MSREPTDDELVEKAIAEAIQKEYDLAQREARVPSAEVVWMRAELRAREEAARKALWPIVFGQAISIAAFVGLLVALVSQLSIAALPPIPVRLLEVVVASWLVLAPLALYLAFARDWIPGLPRHSLRRRLGLPRRSGPREGWNFFLDFDV